MLLDSLRMVEQALRQHSHSADPAKLLPLHFKMAEDALRQSLGAKRAYKVAGKLEYLANMVDRLQIAKGPIRHQNALARPSNQDGVDKEAQAEGLKKMVSEDALNALAEIANDPRDDRECILIRHIELLVYGGFRIGEALSLPVDCWIDEPGKDAFDRPVIRSGIRYWPEKGGEPIVKWLPLGAREIAKRAIQEIEGLCRPARDMAIWMEANPGRLYPLAEFGQTQTLKKVEYARRLGVSLPGFSNYIDGKGLLQNPTVYQVEKAYLERYNPKPVVFRGGKSQMLSGSLSVVFENFFSYKTTLSFLAGPIQRQVISDALGAREGVQDSIFKRREMKDAKGEYFSAKSHGFRHWLNTKAAGGGLTEVDIARFFGRRDLRQNESYMHGTVMQRAEKVRQLILEDKLDGPVVKIFKSLSHEEGIEFLEGQIQAAHTTQYGVCVHNFAEAPCEHHLNCLRGCGDYLRTKGDKDQRTELTKLREATEVNLATAKKAAQAGVYGAGNFVAHNEQVLKGVTAALAVDADEGIADGTDVRTNKSDVT